jgi:hypothetical protein
VYVCAIRMRIDPIGVLVPFRCAFRVRSRRTRLTRLTRLVHHPLGQRNIAQRVMEIRGQLAKEMIQDLSQVGEENSLLMRETLLTSLSLDVDAEDPGNPDV